MQATQCNSKKITICFGFLLLFVAMFTAGCFDLGKFDTLESYYNAFSDVELISQSKTPKSYSFEDYFYNEQSFNYFGGDLVDEDEYIYFVLPVKEDFELVEFAMNIKSSKAGNIHYSIYITNTTLSNIRAYSDPKQKQKLDEHNNPVVDENGDPVFEDIIYDDLSKDDSKYSGTASVKQDKWGSFMVKLTDKQNAKSGIKVESGQYIVVKFENNSGTGFDEGYEKQPLIMTNVLVRAI